MHDVGYKFFSTWHVRHTRNTWGWVNETFHVTERININMQNSITLYNLIKSEGKSNLMIRSHLLRNTWFSSNDVWVVCWVALEIRQRVKRLFRCSGSVTFQNQTSNSCIHFNHYSFPFFHPPLVLELVPFWILEPWFSPETQPTFPPVWIRTSVITDVTHDALWR